MKRCVKVCITFLVIYALLSFLTPTAHAFQTSIPGFTVIVDFPTRDLEVSVRYQDGEGSNMVRLSREQIAWEARYRFGYDKVPQGQLPLKNATLVVSSGGKTFTCTLPDMELLNQDRDFFSVNIPRQTITRGQTVGRATALVVMRVLLTLLAMGALFLAFGYRRRRSWIAFATISLITQSALNVALLGLSSFAGPFLVFYMIPLAVPVLIVELIAFAVGVNEHRRLRTIVYVLVANMLNLLVMMILVTQLPV